MFLLGVSTRPRRSFSWQDEWFFWQDEWFFFDRMSDFFDKMMIFFDGMTVFFDRMNGFFWQGDWFFWQGDDFFRQDEWFFLTGWMIFFDRMNDFPQDFASEKWNTFDMDPECGWHLTHRRSTGQITKTEPPPFRRRDYSTRYETNDGHHSVKRYQRTKKQPENHHLRPKTKDTIRPNNEESPRPPFRRRDHSTNETIRGHHSVKRYQRIKTQSESHHPRPRTKDTIRIEGPPTRCISTCWLEPSEDGESRKKNFNTNLSRNMPLALWRDLAAQGTSLNVVTLMKQQCLNGTAANK